MITPNKNRLERFLALNWYETALRFVATFVAKTSELLLAAGLVVSTANFLLDGNVLNNAQATAWAWVQALALDSSLGISFYSVLQCLKQRDWVKFALYTILTGLLTLVAGSITKVDIFSHAVHTTMSSALARLGFDVGLLSTLRAIAVVGFVLMSRLKDVSFRDLYRANDAEATAPTPATLGPDGSSGTPASEAIRSTLAIEEAALLFPYAGGAGSLEPPVAQMPAMLPSGSGEQRQVEQAPANVEPQSPGPEPALPQEPLAPQVQVEPRQEPSTAPMRSATIDPASRAPHGASHAGPEDGAGQGREERLEQAYQFLVAARKKVSARALAEGAHVHRSTCARWLQARTSGPTSSPVPAPTRLTEEGRAPHLKEPEPPAQGNVPSLPHDNASPGDSTGMRPLRNIPGHRKQP
jgi:hypothetical protein